MADNLAVQRKACFGFVSTILAVFDTRLLHVKNQEYYPMEHTSLELLHTIYIHHPDTVFHLYIENNCLEGNLLRDIVLGRKLF